MVRNELIEPSEIKQFLQELQIKAKDPQNEYRPMNLDQIQLETIKNWKREVKVLYKNQPKEEESNTSPISLAADVLKNQCPYKNCLKIFKHSTSLQHHIKTHTGEKPFECRFCGKTFITNGNKKDHERRHLDLKLFKCENCGEKFHRGN
jgi:uncharacterized Zn-finger protein